MTRHQNCKIQLDNRINNLSAIGESKYSAKTAYRHRCEERGEKWNPSKSPFIHSENSIKDYRQTVNEFCAWAREYKSDIYASKDLNNFTKDVCYEYLQLRDITCSAWTVTKDQSALNKVFNYDLNKQEGHLSRRNQTDVTRSRVPRGMDTKYNSNNYKDAIKFSQSFGLRRESIKGGDYQVKESSLFQKDGRVYCSVIEKGGRYREAPCLEKNQEDILKKYNVEEREFGSKETFKFDYRRSTYEPLFPKYTTMIDNHAFRGEYSRNLYAQLVDAKEFGEPDSEQKYYKGYYEDIVQQVSNALGHNRLNVVVTSYFK